MSGATSGHAESSGSMESTSAKRRRISDSAEKILSEPLYKILWQYGEGEWGRWVDFDPDFAGKLEAARRGGDQSIVLRSADMEKYEFDVVNMVQTNITTQVKIPLRRGKQDPIEYNQLAKQYYSSLSVEMSGESWFEQGNPPDAS